MNNDFEKHEIRWRAKVIYVDMDTGEILTINTVKESYDIITTKKKSNVYRTTGTITITNECRISRQGKLF